jgi:hypothetical protein
MESMQIVHELEMFSSYTNGTDPLYQHRDMLLESSERGFFCGEKYSFRLDQRCTCRIFPDLLRETLKKADFLRLFFTFSCHFGLP